MSLQKLITVKLCTACIFTVIFSAPAAIAEITGEVDEPCKTRKNACPASALFQCSRVRSDAAYAAAADHKATPPSPMKNARRGAPPPPVIRPPNAAVDHQFVDAQLYTAHACHS